MKDTVTLREFIAILVRRGKLLIALAAIFAIVLGTWKVVDLRANDIKGSPEQIEERYQLALERYEREKRTLELERQLFINQKQHASESLLLKLDPYQKAVTTMRIFLDADELSLPEIARAQSLYLAYWNRADLQEALQHSSQTSYLREVLFLNGEDGGVLVLTAWGKTTEDAEQLADAAYAYIQMLQKEVAKVSGEHALYLAGKGTTVEADPALAKTIFEELERSRGHEEYLKTVETALNKLAEPVREVPMTGKQLLAPVIKYAMLGSVLGLLLGVAWVLFGYLFRNRLEVSRQLTEGFSIPCLGAVARRKGIFGRAADRILNEQTWQDEQKALAYLEERARTCLKDGCRVVLLTSLPGGETEPAMQKIGKALENNGYQVSVASDCEHCAEAISAIREADCVVLAERCGTSKWDNILKEIAMTNEMQTPICGFVLV